MKTLAAAVLAAFALAGATNAQGLVDKGFIAGWNIMVDPQMGNGCLIQTVYEDLSVVRIGYDGTADRGYFVVFNKAWGQVEQGQSYTIRFELDGQSFDGVAQGLYLDKVPGGVVFFDDPAFVDAISQSRTLTLFGQTGERIMGIDLTGSSKAIEQARKCHRGEF